MVVSTRIVLSLLGVLGAIQAGLSSNFLDRYSASYAYPAFGVIVFLAFAVGWMIGGLVGQGLVRGFKRVERAASRPAVRVSSPWPRSASWWGCWSRRSCGFRCTPCRTSETGSSCRCSWWWATCSPTSPPRSTAASCGWWACTSSSTRACPGRPTPVSRRWSTRARSSTAASPTSSAPGSCAASWWSRSSCCASCSRSPTPATRCKRARGRRGLEVVQGLRSEVTVATPEIDFPELADVDAKLLKLAKQRGLRILTTDYNLNRLARIQDVVVLNVNELANALKPAVLPGERLASGSSARARRPTRASAISTTARWSSSRAAAGGSASTVDVAGHVACCSRRSGKMIFTRIGESGRRMTAERRGRSWSRRGDGRRLGHERPKAFVKLGGRPLVAHAIELLEGHPRVDGIVVVVPEGWEEPTALLADELAAGEGRRRRSPADRRGALGAQRASPRCAETRDRGARARRRPAARRPRRSSTGSLDALEGADGAVPALPVSDTVKRVHDGAVAETLDRAELRAVQTPQAFRAEALRRAYAGPPDDISGATDCAQLVERTGGRVVVVEGEAGQPEDHRCRRPGPRRGGRQGGRMSDEMRVGIGVDAHAFAEGRTLVLGGVEIEHDRGLAGHSDADVVCHAACDAILGAAGLEDIGHLFPPGDPAYEGASSVALLGDAWERVRALGWELVNLDAVVILEEPRIAPHRERDADGGGRGARGRARAASPCAPRPPTSSGSPGAARAPPATRWRCYGGGIDPAGGRLVRSRRDAVGVHADDGRGAAAHHRAARGAHPGARRNADRRGAALLPSRTRRRRRHLRGAADGVVPARARGSRRRG